MVIVIDTNIILDALLKREPFDLYAYEILKSCDRGQIKAYIASFAAVSYTHLTLPTICSV